MRKPNTQRLADIATICRTIEDRQSQAIESFQDSLDFLNKEDDLEGVKGFKGESFHDFYG